MSKLVGLDIGSSIIKVVELERIGRSYTLTAIGAAQTPSKGFMSEAPADQQALADAIRKVCQDAGITTRSVNVSLPENLIFTKIVEMPQLSEKELASAIQWEAEQYIPLPLSEVVMDKQIIEEHIVVNNAPKMRVLLVAAPKTLVSKTQKIIQMAGLDCSSIETEVLALNRSLLEAGNDTLTTLVISVGDKTTTVFVSRNASVVLTYVIPTGGAVFTRVLSSELGIDPMQAEEYKKTYGLKQDVLSGKIAQTLHPLLENLVAELKRAIAYYQSQGGNADPIKRAVLTSGTSKLPGLVVYLTENLGIETQLGDPWVHVIQSQRLANLTLDPSLFSQAIGLAMKPT